MDDVEGIKSLVKCRSLEPLQRRKNSGFGNAFLGRSVFISLQSQCDVWLEKIADNFVARGTGRSDEAAPGNRGRVGVIHDERLPGFNASLEELRLAVTGFQQIKADSHMTLEKALLVKRAFSTALNPDENHGLHISII